MMLFGLVATVLGSRTVLIKATPRRRVKLVALYTSSLRKPRRFFQRCISQPSIEQCSQTVRTALIAIPKRRCSPQSSLSSTVFAAAALHACDAIRNGRLWQHTPRQKWEM